MKTTISCFKAGNQCLCSASRGVMQYYTPGLEVNGHVSPLYSSILHYYFADYWIGPTSLVDLLYLGLVSGPLLPPCVQPEPVIISPAFLALLQPYHAAASSGMLSGIAHHFFPPLTSLSSDFHFFQPAACKRLLRYLQRLLSVAFHSPGLF
ncbi:hypothetical protein GDO81_022744 [Engystomops pustulosus]|uniref:Uncharacterized protein n=1 Tax=Engystomops pustulosus TaxID=76066 RepID=A0AAV6YLS1_ENGPU|nr:hypothetical protein GDO81_022744 [Engystomops pustulosus]